MMGDMEKLIEILCDSIHFQEKSSMKLFLAKVSRLECLFFVNKKSDKLKVSDIVLK